MSSIMVKVNIAGNDLELTTAQFLELLGLMLEFTDRKSLLSTSELVRRQNAPPPIRQWGGEL